MSACIEYRLPSETADALRVESPGSEALPKRNVLIYRNDLIERSETFIVAQAEAMRNFNAIYCGLTRCRDGLLPKHAEEAVLVSSRPVRGFIEKHLYMHGRSAPLWVSQCNAYDPVLMHAHFALDGAFALPLCRALRIPLVVSLHGYDVTYSKAAFRRTAGGRLFLRRRAELLADARLFVCISAFIRDRALEQGYPEEKLWLHRTGIDPRMFRPAAGVQREAIVLFVGRLIEKKGCAHLVRAMESVRRQHPAVQLVVIGDGPLRAELDALAKAVLRYGFTFLGAQPLHVIRSWLRRAMVFSVPSVTASNGNAEGLGMVFCEAQAMGVPVVSFRSGGIAEAVLDGRTGYLLNEKDEKGLADRISELLKDKELWERMSRRGQKEMSENFDLAVQTGILERKYEEILVGQSR